MVGHPQSADVNSRELWHPPCTKDVPSTVGRKLNHPYRAWAGESVRLTSRLDMLVAWPTILMC
jgi:hypothetical protein